jgi:hypothetical protein
MTPPAVSCPSCGAPIDTHNPGIIMAVCEHCGNAVYWDQQRVQSAGKQSVPASGFTRLYTGAAGALMGKRFRVEGRVRYSFGFGFWDEWFVELADGSTAWITEDNHELCVETPLGKLPLEPWGNYRPGAKINAGGQEFVVEEVGHAQCIGVEGNLPFRIEAGEKYDYIDASTPDGRDCLGVEYDEATPTAYHGHWLSYASVVLDDEGDEW